MKNFFGLLTGSAFRPDINNWLVPLSFDRTGNQPILLIHYRPGVNFTLNCVDISDESIKTRETEFKAISGDSTLANEGFDSVILPFIRKHGIKHVVVTVDHDVNASKVDDFRFSSDVEELRDLITHDEMDRLPDDQSDLIPEALVKATYQPINDGSAISLYSHPDESVKQSILFEANVSGFGLREFNELLIHNDLNLIKVDFSIAALLRRASLYIQTQAIDNCDLFISDRSNAIALKVRSGKWSFAKGSFRARSGLSTEVDTKNFGIKDTWDSFINGNGGFRNCEDAPCERALVISSFGHELKDFFKSHYQESEILFSNYPIMHSTFDLQAADAQSFEPTHDINFQKKVFLEHLPSKFLLLRKLLYSAIGLAALLFIGLHIYGRIQFSGMDQLKQSIARNENAIQEAKEAAKKPLELKRQAKIIYDWVSLNPSIQNHTVSILKMAPAKVIYNNINMEYDFSKRLLDVQLQIEGNESDVRKHILDIEAYFDRNNFKRTGAQLPDPQGTLHTYKGVFINQGGILDGKNTDLGALYRNRI
tara:strand:+ start:7751 stop:9361 length:1611 start_codon:yes stop_codon:yes gene_type:complete